MAATSEDERNTETTRSTDSLFSEYHEPDNTAVDSASPEPKPLSAGDPPRYFWDGNLRVIVCSTEAAANGQLGDVNAALDRGWHLHRVEVRHRPRSSRESRFLTFILAQSDP
ncbi:hypothetical protein [Longibacter salinarum]|uniref:hypothetical protein n=1 Tax=Longibacter salinarum TaxID=1850348 RepID=UPI00117F06E7|nr:hypothetical protein [Longibacter salinarum]